MSEQLTEKVSFDFIRYANCWEDADVLIKGLNPLPSTKLLSVGSAGDNSFSLLTTDPELVVAVDVNIIQLYLIELKKVCIQHFTRGETLEFLGFNPSIRREALFNQVKSSLGSDARNYWEHNVEMIRFGIIHSGKFEKYFQYFSKRILPWIHTKKRTGELLSNKPASAQEKFYHSKWNTWRWRLLFKIFFSKYVLGKYGRDPEFLREVTVPVGEYIFNKAAVHLASVQAQENFILRYNLTGSFGHLLPHYLEEKNYALIQSRISRFKISHGFAQDAISQYGKFNHMNLSNIFEYMNPELFLNTSTELVEALPAGGRLGYWNLMVPRRISAVMPGSVKYLSELSHQLTAEDKGFFYNQFIVDQVL